MLLRTKHKCGIVADMSDLLSQFEADCSAAEIAPTAALQAGGVHKTLWWKWKAGAVSPTLRNFENAKAGLQKLVEEKSHAREAAA
jgi:hypothetical protein